MQKLWKKWKQIAQIVGDVQTMILFSILYLVIVTPIGIVSQLTHDYLRKNQFPKWLEMPDNTSSIKKMREQS